MTERRRGSVQRDATSFRVGPSSVRWEHDALTIEIDEVTVPLPSRLRGTVRLHPQALTDHVVTLDDQGQHRWRPIAPCARVEVSLDRPALRWSGPGYLDTNAGAAPLEAAFSSWHWSRAALRRGTAILYDVRRRDGSGRSLAIRCDPAGAVEAVPMPPEVDLPRTRWRVARATRADAGHAVKVVRTLEDAPFYARSLLATRLLGEDAPAVHESLSLDRFDAGWVQMLLPFRMPRALR